MTDSVDRADGPGMTVTACVADDTHTTGDAHVIDDVALIFEGGGMRASYSSGAVNTLLENNIRFRNVYGVSAGSSCTVNYLSGDIDRTKRSFVDLAADPKFGDTKTLLAHKGMFNAHYIYQETCLPGQALPFDFDAFTGSGGHACIESFAQDSGKTVYWTEKDMPTLGDLMLRVRASSSLPFFMPAPAVDGQRFLDGGLGEGAGLILNRAKRDGFERFFIVLTRPRGYRKVAKNEWLINSWFWRRPEVRHALLTRPGRYNATLDEIERLAATGAAYVFYADEMRVTSGTTDVTALQESYDSGYAQAQRELEDWGAFLGL